MTYSSKNIKFKKATNINMQTNAFFETTNFIDTAQPHVQDVPKVNQKTTKFRKETKANYKP